MTGFVGVSYFDEQGSQRSPTQYDERYALAFATGTILGPNAPSLATVQAIDIAYLTSLTGSAPAFSPQRALPGPPAAPLPG